MKTASRESRFRTSKNFLNRIDGKKILFSKRKIMRSKNITKALKALQNKLKK